MTDKLFALSETDVDALRGILSRYRAGNLGRPKTDTPGLPPRSNVLFGVPDATITGTTGSATNPANGTLSVYNFTSTGGTSDTGSNVTAYNMRSVDSTTDSYAICTRDYQSGNWMILPSLAGAATCSLCTGTVPDPLTVVIAGVANGFGCVTCNTLNISYSCAYIGQVAGACTWRSATFDYCGRSNNYVEAQAISGAFWGWDIYVRDGITGSAQFRGTDYGAAWDCAAQEVINLTASGMPVECVWTSATATVN